MYHLRRVTAVANKNFSLKRNVTYFVPIAQKKFHKYNN